MTKAEKKWIYGGIVLATGVFVFLLYLISNYSPLAQSDQGAELNNLENTSTSEATSSLKLNFDPAK